MRQPPDEILRVYFFQSFTNTSDTILLSFLIDSITYYILTDTLFRMNINISIILKYRYLSNKNTYICE